MNCTFQIESKFLAVVLTGFAALIGACGSSGNGVIIVRTPTPTPTQTATPMPTQTPTQTSTATATPITPSFVGTGNMTTARSEHRTILLSSGPHGGEALIVGGANGTGPLASAELYDPATATFATTGSMTTARLSPTATLLVSGPLAGQVLITGGSNSASGLNASAILATAELYNPATGSFTATGNMTRPRVNHTATLLTSGPLAGQVLIAGGISVVAPGTINSTASAELYDPSTGVFTATSSMIGARETQTATLLTTGPLAGQVLVAGGFNDLTLAPLASAELYNPTTGSFTSTGSMIIARTMHTATPFSSGTLSGQVLVAGGSGDNGSVLASAELYDPTTGVFTATGSMNTARAGQTATFISVGPLAEKVLITGGDDAIHDFASAELYDESTGSFSLTASMSTARTSHTATLFPSGPLAGDVLIAGGLNSTTGALSTAELYQP